MNQYFIAQIRHIDFGPSDVFTYVTSCTRDKSFVGSDLESLLLGLRSEPSVQNICHSQYIHNYRLF